MGGLLLEVGIAVELDQLQATRRAPCAGPALLQSFLGRAVAGRLAARADDHVGRAPGAGLEGDDAAAAELDVVGMTTERQQGRRLRSGVRHRLHQARSIRSRTI